MSRHSRKRIVPGVRGLAIASIAALCLPLSQAWGQSPESDLTPESEGLARDADEYAVPPGIPDATLKRFDIEDAKDRFDVKFGIVALVDYTSFDQDDASYGQVGNQSDKLEARSLRLSARGFFNLGRRWDYMASYEYKGFDQTSESDWNVTDLRIGTKLGPGTLTIGKIKQAHVYEMVGDAANLPHHERVLSPFFVSREVGVSYAGQMPDQAGTWSIGWHNNWLTENEDWGDSGNDFAARVTWLPLWQEEGRNFVHLGGSVRYVGNDRDVLRMRGKPASNAASDFVDTGNLDSDHAWNFGLEALANKGPWSLLAEYVQADVNSTAAGDPSFSGWYLTGSWVVTGDYRPYDRKAGYARRVMPQGEWGAVELVARVGRVDLEDAAVDGGTMDGWWLGVNWWATRRWKASIGYGNIDLDRFGIEGHTETLLSRIQWIY
jgi:phosphate-selective porin OprO and OprP